MVKDEFHLMMHKFFFPTYLFKFAKLNKQFGGRRNYPIFNINNLI